MASLYSYEITVELLIRGKVWSGRVCLFLMKEQCFLLKQQQIPGRLLSWFECQYAEWPLASSTVLNTVGHCRGNMLKHWWVFLHFFKVLPRTCTSFSTLRYALVSRRKLVSFRATKISCLTNEHRRHISLKYTLETIDIVDWFDWNTLKLLQ